MIISFSANFFRLENLSNGLDLKHFICTSLSLQWILQVDAVSPGSVLQTERLSLNVTNVIIINLIGMRIICAHENILAMVVTFSRLR